MREVFDSKYTEAKWGWDPISGSTSGPGSQKDAALPFTVSVTKFIDQNKVASVLDIGCGDWAIWTSEDFMGVTYLGIDASKTVIARNKEKFASTNVSFENLDAVNGSLQVSDLVIIKDVLQHLSNRDVSKLLSKVQSRYLIICNDVRFFPVKTFWKELKRRISIFINRGFNLKDSLAKQNTDIQNGEYRCIDVTKKPFFFGRQSYRLLETFFYPGSSRKRTSVRKRVDFFQRFEVSDLK